MDRREMFYNYIQKCRQYLHCFKYNCSYKYFVIYIQYMFVKTSYSQLPSFVVINLKNKIDVYFQTKNLLQFRQLLHQKDIQVQVGLIINKKTYMNLYLFLTNYFLSRFFFPFSLELSVTSPR